MNKNALVRKFLSGLVVLLASASVFAGPIYNISSTIGAGSVNGTIETDGTIGVLGEAQILDWNLALDDGTTTFTLLGPLSGNNSQVRILGARFTATASDLLFDFSGVDSFVLFQNPSIGSGVNFWCVDGTIGACGPPGDLETVKASGTAQIALKTGEISVGTAAAPPPPTATLTLAKTVVNDDGGTAVDTDFTLTATGPDVISGVEGDLSITSAVVAVGDYALTESALAGYTQAGWSCTRGLSGSNVTLAVDDVVTCTVTNTDDTPSPPPADATPVPTMSAYGLVLTMLGFLLVAGRRLRASAKRR